MGHMTHENVQAKVEAAARKAANEIAEKIQKAEASGQSLVYGPKSALVSICYTTIMQNTYGDAPEPKEVQSSPYDNVNWDKRVPIPEEVYSQFLSV
jgi:hypothetical protein